MEFLYDSLMRVKAQLLFDTNLPLARLQAIFSTLERKGWITYRTPPQLSEVRPAGRVPQIMPRVIQFLAPQKSPVSYGVIIHACELNEASARNAFRRMLDRGELTETSNSKVWDKKKFSATPAGITAAEEYWDAWDNAEANAKLIQSRMPSEFGPEDFPELSVLAFRLAIGILRSKGLVDSIYLDGNTKYYSLLTNR